jgi:intracellular sulfur oxidation DsrE/DsrF family protein
MTPRTPRRGFLQAVAAMLAGLGGLSGTVSAQESQAPGVPVDEQWLQGLTGKHRQMFDVATSKDGRPLGRLANFLDAYAEAYGTTDSDVNAIFGVHGNGLPLLLNDSIWAKYEFGKRYGEIDPQSGAPAVRNPWARGSASSVARLRERGVRFIACQRSIRRLSGELATGGVKADDVRAELLGNLLPGVTPVPAMIVAVNRAHEAGLSYAYIG